MAREFGAQWLETDENLFWVLCPVSSVPIYTCLTASIQSTCLIVTNWVLFFLHQWIIHYYRQIALETEPQNLDESHGSQNGYQKR